MELERNAMLMYTSCGWFFDDISGIETVQVMAYAARVLQLATVLFGEAGAALEAPFESELAKAKSNVAEQRDGAHIYRTQVKPKAVTLEQVAAHHVIGSLFPQQGNTAVDAYLVEPIERQENVSGRARLATGRTRVESTLTRASMQVNFAVLHFGDQNLTAAVQRADSGPQAFAAFTEMAHRAFLLGNLPEVVREMDAALGRSTYSLHSLFTDEQRRILGLLTQRTVIEVEAGLRAIYGQHTSILHFLADAHLPQPPALRALSGFVTGSSLFIALDRRVVSAGEIADLLERIRSAQVPLDEPRLSYAATQRAKRELVGVQISLLAHDRAPQAVHDAVETIRAIRQLPLELNLWQAQNIWYQCRRLANNLEPVAAEDFAELGSQLDFAVTELPPATPAS